MIDPWATSCSKQSKSNEMSVVWQEQESVREFLQHNNSSKSGEEKVRGGVPFIPLEAKGGGLDQGQVLVG
jgi:hypothetical protein